MTYRERREAKVERLQEWASKREAKAEASFDRAHQIGGAIPLGQPILVGHHSERRHRRDVDRIHSAMTRGTEHQEKAESMSQKAKNIESALDRSIYSDDPDAIEQLEARIAELEAERVRIKAYNASCRKGERDLSILAESEKSDLLTTARVASFQLGANGEFPSYKLSNLGGNINRNRKRLEALRASA